MPLTYYFENPDDPSVTGWNPSNSDDLEEGYNENKKYEKSSQKIVAAEPTEQNCSRTGDAIQHRIAAIRRGERPGAYLLKDGHWYVSCKENANIWTVVRPAAVTPGPRKPPPALPAEVWNTKKIDTAAAWKELQLLCKL